ncbi:hypothetical protein B296_00022978 [Ensete ventricosum]|uniref:Uncharacterized protein n=1 Tax=Ensete ventricosum TaxID=4639 RepID=A0A426ZV65_ENSVE|nr:hypothetical protein B296_00022978 [Ensete ventricosum]
MGFYSNDYGAFVPEALILPIAYHTVALHHVVRGPRGKARIVLPTTGGCRPCPPYLCQVGCTTVDPSMLVSRPAPTRRVGHVGGPAVRGRGDVAARSIPVISGSILDDLDSRTDSYNSYMAHFRPVKHGPPRQSR